MEHFDLDLVGSGKRTGDPYPFSKRYFRDLCKTAVPAGAFKLPGRGGWAIARTDWAVYLRTHHGAVAAQEMSVEDELRAAGYR